MTNVGILGMGKYVPEDVLTNSDLEKMVDTNDEWIRTRTGISERRIAKNLTTVDMAYNAALDALEKSKINKDEIGLIIVASVTMEQKFPSIANLVQERLGIKNAAAFDLSAACSGFIYGLTTATQFLKTNFYKYALVIGTEKLSRLIDWEDRNTCVLFGDGAGAAVLGEVDSQTGFLSFEIGSDGSGGKHLYEDEKTSHIVMNGREVFKFAVRQMGESAMNVVEKAGLQKEDVDFLIPHQANIRIIDAARERLGLPEEKVSITVDKYGNTSSASIPLSLCHELENGNIHKGDVLVLVGFGGGLTWGAAAIKWSY